MSHTELTNHVVVQEGEYSIVYNDETKTYDGIMPGIVNITTIYNIFVADTEAEVLEFIEEEGLTLEDPELT
jgi:hypothetical protein